MRQIKRISNKTPIYLFLSFFIYFVFFVFFFFSLFLIKIIIIDLARRLQRYLERKKLSPDLLDDLAPLSFKKASSTDIRNAMTFQGQVGIHLFNIYFSHLLARRRLQMAQNKVDFPLLHLLTL